jgi:hypothetical protein
MSEPIQPTPPVPPVPPVPRYGEYAPAGSVPQQPAPAAEPYATQPAAAQPYGAASYPAQQPEGRQRKRWDLILTIILLVVGFFGMLLGLFYAALLPELIAQAYSQQGLGTFSGDTSVAAPVIAVSHVVLYLLAVGGSIPLLLSKRIAFWVPLTAGVIAAVFFWGAFTAALLSDPNFVSQYS